MSIVFYCMNVTCPNRLRVEDEFIGKEVRCPTCLHIIVVPDESAPEIRVIRTISVARPPSPPAALPPLALASSPAPAQPPPGLVCPSCLALLTEAAVLCIACGFNLRTGEILVTEREDADE